MVMDISEQKYPEETTQHPSRLPEIVAAISGRLTDLSTEQRDEGIRWALAQVGQYAAAEHGCVHRLVNNGTAFDCAHYWHADDTSAAVYPLRGVAVDSGRWPLSRILADQNVLIPSARSLPAECAAEQREMQRLGLESLLIVPMTRQQTVLGFLALASRSAARSWTEQDIPLMRTVANVCCQALAYRTALARGAQGIRSTGNLHRRLDEVLDRLGSVIPCDNAWVLDLRPDVSCILAYRGPLNAEQARRTALALSHEVISGQESKLSQPTVVSDTEVNGEHIDPTQIPARDEDHVPDASTRSWIGLPLLLQHKVIGMLALSHHEPAAYSDLHAQLAISFPQQAATAIANARLSDAEQERLLESEQRQQLAEGLSNTIAAVNAGKPIQDILDIIVAQAAMHLGASACVMSRFDLDREQFAHQATYGWPAELEEQIAIPFARQRETGSGDYVETVLQRKPSHNNYGPLPDRLDEIRNNPSLPPEIKTRRITIRKHFAASLAVPLVVGRQDYGGLLFYYSRPQAFSEEQVQLALNFSEQAALAIENAQLRQLAAQTAVATERNRLARELHDAVTQTLYSASMVADMLPRIWDRDPSEGHRRLAELGQMTRGALAEMRMLLLELRPSALIDAELSDLLQQLGQSMTGRARLPVTVAASGECRAPDEVKLVLYRIAQEALNNIAKHAQASTATVTLDCTEAGEITLVISDDGRGFDPSRIPAGHLGLGIIQERAESVGALVRIESQVDLGTQVCVTWNLAQAGEC